MKIDERSEENVVYSDEKRNCPSGQFHFNIKCCLLAAERGRKMYEIGIDMGGTHTAVGLVDGLTLKDRVEFATDTEQGAEKYIEELVGKKRIGSDGHFLHRHGCAGKLQYADGNDRVRE